MSFRFASRLDGVGLSMIRQITQQSGGCINLGIGEPEFPAPEGVREAARRMLEGERIGYSPNAGIPQLCARVLDYHGGRSSHSVCITNGSQEALFATLFALVDSGDEVLVPDPGFVAYPSVVRLAGGIPVPYPLRPDTGFRLEPSDLEARVGERTRAIVLCSPSNPTGRALGLEELRQVAELARRHRLALISDEIYREIYYTAAPSPSISEVTEEAVLLSGVSKMASMTGWRVGWACGPAEIVDRVTVMHQYISTCASTLSQRAALQVFTEEGRAAVARIREALSSNRELICSRIREELNRPFVPPEGAFYLMLSVQDLEQDSLTISLELLRDGVATIPGAAFGDQGEGFLRISFAGEPDRILAGIGCLKKGLERLASAGRGR